MELIKLNGYNDEKVLISKQSLELFLKDEADGQSIQDFQSEYTYDDTEYLWGLIRNGYAVGYKVFGYFVHQDDQNELNGATVTVVIDENDEDRLTYYSPIGQHSEGSRDYFEELVKITPDEYMEAAGPNWTPEDYL